MELRGHRAKRLGLTALEAVLCRIYLEAAPDDTTLIRWAKLIGPKTLEGLNERVVALAFERNLSNSG